jgi:myo-inositol-1(or 4)-monophosphatase
MKYDLLETMITVSLRAGNFIRHYYELGEFGVSEKRDSHDLVTNIDHESQRIIQEELIRRFPDIPIVGEEDEHIIKKEHAFFIDPLDGTLNFVKQIPFFAVSIGYWKNNEPLCGVVYDPLRHDLFYARKNHGTYLNGKELHLADNKSKHQLLASDWGHEPRLYQKNIQIMQRLMKENTYLFRFMGCASLGISYVGAGILDGYWHYKLSPWDMAAGVLIAQEAGASVSHLDGRTFDLWGQNILALTPNLQERFIYLFQQVDS